MFALVIRMIPHFTICSGGNTLQRFANIDGGGLQQLGFPVVLIGFGFFSGQLAGQAQVISNIGGIRLELGGNSGLFVWLREQE